MSLTLHELTKPALFCGCRTRSKTITLQINKFDLKQQLQSKDNTNNKPLPPPHGTFPRTLRANLGRMRNSAKQKTENHGTRPGKSYENPNHLFIKVYWSVFKFWGDRVKSQRKIYSFVFGKTLS